MQVKVEVEGGGEGGGRGGGWEGGAGLRRQAAYSANSPGKGLTSLSSMIQMVLHTAEMSDTLCVITITPPSNLLIAWIRQSTVSRSRWLVGSSSSSRCVRRSPSSTKTTRDFCPPESVVMSCSW